MSGKILYLIIVFLIVAIAGSIVYTLFGSQGEEKKNSELSEERTEEPSLEEEFDFQVVLPEGSIYKLEEIEDLEVVVAIASTIWFEEAEEVEISLVHDGKFEFTDSFLSESMPFGKITVNGTQQGKNGEDAFLDMSAYVFYRPCVKDIINQEHQDYLDFCLWPAESPIIIDSRSTATTCLINNYLVFSGSSSAENPFVYSLPSSMETLSDLYELLSHPKFPELQNEVNSLLLTGTDSFLPLWIEEGIANITLEILELGEPSFLPSEEDLRDLPQAKDAEITFQLGQELWKIAVGLENFDEFSVTNPVVTSIVNKVAENGGELIIQKLSSSAHDFCAYSRLNMKRNGLAAWYCIEANGAKCYLTTDPSVTCNQDSYICSCSF